MTFGKQELKMDDDDNFQIASLLRIVNFFILNQSGERGVTGTGHTDWTALLHPSIRGNPISHSRGYLIPPPLMFLDNKFETTYDWLNTVTGWKTFS